MAASFYASPLIGATTTLACFAHEIPHEIADYSILIRSGFTKKQAMQSQFLTAVGAFVRAPSFFLTVAFNCGFQWGRLGESHSVHFVIIVLSRFLGMFRTTAPLLGLQSIMRQRQVRLRSRSIWQQACDKMPMD